jgi:hypothetical protein
MIQSYDKDLYVNYDNCITLHTLIDIKKKTGISPIVDSTYNKANPHLYNISNNQNSRAFKYKEYSIDEVLSNIKTKTIVPVTNPVVEFKEVDVIEPYIPRVIIDGMKHKTYYVLLHQWYYLNPNVEIDYLYNFLFYVNNVYAKPRMEVRELSRFFTHVISRIKETGKINIKTKKRWIHWNLENSSLSSQEKVRIARVLTGAHTRKINIEKINSAKIELRLMGKKETIKAIAELTNLDPGTVSKRINDKPIDMDYEVSLWN